MDGVLFMMKRFVDLLYDGAFRFQSPDDIFRFS